MKLLLLIMTIIVWSMSALSFVQAIEVKAPLQSANSVMYNDCNLRLTNADLLLKRLGNDPAKSFWTRDDVVFAHLKTVTDIQCGWVAGMLFVDEFNANLVDNLCTVWLAKIGRWWAEKYWLTSYTLAKDYRNRLATSGTSAEWIVPKLVGAKLLDVMWSPIVSLNSDTTPEKCGSIDISSNPWLNTIYTNLANSIEQIVTDCGANVSDNPQRIPRVVAMLWSPKDTSYVFSLKQWWSRLSTSLINCRGKIQQQQLQMLQWSQNVSIAQVSQFATESLAATRSNYEQQNKVNSESMAALLGWIKDVAQQTPTVQQCAPTKSA